MADISVIVCAHNPRQDYLGRVMGALKCQSLPEDQWELLVVDNASKERLADTWDLSWHARSRHLREDSLGLIAARFLGIAESRGQLLVFVDDDNVLAPDFLEQAVEISRRYPCLGAFGSGRLEPQFEVLPPEQIRSRLPMLALRTVSFARWSNSPREHDEAIPWGAGLCVTRSVAMEYRRFVERLGISAILGRKGAELFSGDDDVFSWVAASLGSGFGVFPELRVTHLIEAHRVTRQYVLDLIRGHAFSHGALRCMLEGNEPRRIDWFRCVHVLLHGIRHGRFSMRCQWAQSRGEDNAARYLASKKGDGFRNDVSVRRQFSHQAPQRKLFEGAHFFSSFDSQPARVGIARPEK